ncbi:MAG: hypothetical protein R3E12_10560 [Candidatus Eisenbacteria bacterium]|uniref:Outer membrane beta-barrel protein n=1 Tax=Eiseniibacteriota bacterium TaxID=2212470 RepID=A0A956LXX0_UNCEI|nr:outer membrane beta-barrel protein [Candidatus Eisenbacteria bacterium]
MADICGREVDGHARWRFRAGGVSLGRVLLVVVLAMTFGWSLPREARAYEQRSNTISLGIQGGVGLMSGSGDFEPDTTTPTASIPYDAFDLGPGLAIHIRYSLDRTHALGVTFEDLRFDRKTDAIVQPTQFQLNNFLAQYYVYFNRRSKVSQYVVAGAGFHRATFRLGDDSSIQPGEGLAANLGVGSEYFLRRPFSIDASLRGYWLKPKQGTIVGGELFLGIHYYLTR